jgi:hypothetical protein
MVCRIAGRFHGWPGHRTVTYVGCPSRACASIRRLIPGIACRMLSITTSNCGRMRDHHIPMRSDRCAFLAKTLGWTSIPVRVAEGISLICMILPCQTRQGLLVTFLGLTRVRKRPVTCEVCKVMAPANGERQRLTRLIIPRLIDTRQGLEERRRE